MTGNSQPLRVAYLTNEYPKVSHSFIRREITALERAGCEVVRYATHGWNGTLVDTADVAERGRTTYLLQRGTPALLLELLACAVRSPGAFWRGLRLAGAMSRRADRSLPYHLIYLAQASLLKRLAGRDGVRHVHAHFGTNPAEVAMLSSALGGPSYSFTVHGPEDFDKPEFLGMHRKIAQAAFVVAISSYCRSQLMRWSDHAQWGKLHVVHCGLDADDVARQAVPVAGESPAFVCVGRLCGQKGQLLLLDAWAVLRSRGFSPRLVLAGDGEMRGEIQSRIAALGLTQQVRITGWLSGSQVRDEIEQSRALVLPSFAEGLPVVLMEAMAMARPVISTFVAAIPELVRPGVDGWLVPSGDVMALADAVQDCLQADAPALARMGCSGQERVRARHSADQEALKLKRLFALHAAGQPQALAPVADGATA